MYKQAYQLANKHELYGCALQILIDDVRDPCKEDLYSILEKVLQTEKAEEILRKYGSSLVQLVSHVDPKSTGNHNIIYLLSKPFNCYFVDFKNTTCNNNLWYGL